MKQYKFFWSLIVLIVLQQIILWILHWPGRLSIPFFTLLIFSGYQFVRFSIDVLQNRPFLGFISLLSSALLFQWAMKLIFTYYNVFIFTFIIICSIWIILNRRHSKDSLIKHKITQILVPLSFVSIVLIFLSDTLIFKTIEYKSSIPYNPYSEITWDDFKGTKRNIELTLKDRIDSAHAQIHSTFYYKINKVYNYPQVISISSMDPDKSWTVRYGDNLLNHEKTHFYISEYYSQKVNNLNDFPFLNQDIIVGAIESYYDSLTTMQNQFDKETFHGTDHHMEKLWENKVKNLIKR